METTLSNTREATTPTNYPNTLAWDLAALLAAPVRWAAGWLFLSAFIRRFINAPDKMNPDAAGYVGEKFNHFMPHAVAGQKELIEHLLANPSQLHFFLVVFSILEGLCGLGLLTGTLTRLSALGIGLMSYGVLTGAGWLGSTCLDEWQIGTLGIAGSLLIMGTGAGRISMDNYVLRHIRKPWMKWLTSGPLFNSVTIPRRFTLSYIAATTVVVFLMLATYQVFFNGLWGKLHNHSVRPEIELSHASSNPENDTVTFRIYRSGGPDTYGAFLVSARLKDTNGTIIGEIGPKHLASINPATIQNEYLVKVQPKGNALVVPLGGAATLTLTIPHTTTPTTLEVEDVSGLKFQTPIN